MATNSTRNGGILRRAGTLGPLSSDSSEYSLHELTLTMLQWTAKHFNVRASSDPVLTQYLITNLSKLNDLPLLHLHPPSGNYDRRPSSFLKSSSLPKPFSQYYEWEHKYEHFLKISSSLTAIFSPAEFLFLVSGLHGKWAPFWNFNFTWKVVQIERFTELWINAYITITHI